MASRRVSSITLGVAGFRSSADFFGAGGGAGIWPSGKNETGNGGRADDACLISFCRSVELVLLMKEDLGSALIRFGRIDGSIARRR